MKPDGAPPRRVLPSSDLPVLFPSDRRSRSEDRQFLYWFKEHYKCQSVTHRHVNNSINDIPFEFYEFQQRRAAFVTSEMHKARSRFMAKVRLREENNLEKPRKELTKEEEKQFKHDVKLCVDEEVAAIENKAKSDMRDKYTTKKKDIGLVYLEKALGHYMKYTSKECDKEWFEKVRQDYQKALKGRSRLAAGEKVLNGFLYKSRTEQTAYEKDILRSKHASREFWAESDEKLREGTSGQSEDKDLSKSPQESRAKEPPSRREFTREEYIEKFGPAGEKDWDEAVSMVSLKFIKGKPCTYLADELNYGLEFENDDADEKATEPQTFTRSHFQGKWIDGATKRGIRKPLVDGWLDHHFDPNFVAFVKYFANEDFVVPAGADAPEKNDTDSNKIKLYKAGVKYNKDIGIVFQQKGERTCLFSGVASALAAMGLANAGHHVDLVGRRNQGLFDLKSQITVLCECLKFGSNGVVGGHHVYVIRPKCERKKKRKKFNLYDLSGEEAKDLYLVVLQSERVAGVLTSDHAVGVWNGLIFDSTESYALPLSKEAMLHCAGGTGNHCGLKYVIHYPVKKAFKEQRGWLE